MVFILTLKQMGMLGSSNNGYYLADAISML